MHQVGLFIFAVQVPYGTERNGCWLLRLLPHLYSATIGHGIPYGSIPRPHHANDSRVLSQVFPLTVGTVASGHRCPSCRPSVVAVMCQSFVVTIAVAVLLPNRRCASPWRLFVIAVTCQTATPPAGPPSAPGNIYARYISDAPSARPADPLCLKFRVKHL